MTIVKSLEDLDVWLKCVSSENETEEQRDGFLGILH